MEKSFTIQEVENAINRWRNLEKSNTVILGSNTRQLANVYGLMIYLKKVVVKESELSDVQIKALGV